MPGSQFGNSQFFAHAIDQRQQIDGLVWCANYHPAVATGPMGLYLIDGDVDRLEPWEG